MKNWKRPIAAVLAGICCAVGIPQVQLVLPAMQAAAAETADTGTVGVLTYTLESDRAVIMPGACRSLWFAISVYGNSGLRYLPGHCTFPQRSAGRPYR